MGLALATLLPTEVWGQSRSPFDSATTGPLWRANVAGSRQQDGAQPTGARIGGLDVQASVTTTAIGDSNVQRTAAGQQGDVFVIVAPDVSVTSETANRRIALQARAATYRFARLSSQDRETYALSGDVELRVARGVSLAARASHRQAFEPNASSTVSETIGTPARYNSTREEVAAQTETGSLRVNTLVSLERRSYAPILDLQGKVADQSYRDAQTLTFAINGELATPTILTPVVTGAISSIATLRPQACCNRTGNAGWVMAGVRAQATPLIAFELAAGYAYRNFDSNVLQDYSGATWHARGEWYPTPLISVVADASRALQNGGLKDAAGVVVDAYAGKLYYEIRRNLNAIISASATREDYRGTGIVAHEFATGLDITYVANRHLQSSAYLHYRDRTASSLRLPGVGTAIEGGLSLRTAL